MSGDTPETLANPGGAGTRSFRLGLLKNGEIALSVLSGRRFDLRISCAFAHAQPGVLRSECERVADVPAGPKRRTHRWAASSY
jgi:hypothetical protein